jgi:hypothetical protein
MSLTRRNARCGCVCCPADLSPAAESPVKFEPRPLSGRGVKVPIRPKADSLCTGTNRQFAPRTIPRRSRGCLGNGAFRWAKLARSADHKRTRTKARVRAIESALNQTQIGL